METPQEPRVKIPPRTFPLRPVVEAVIQGYALPLGGPHGASHWARVLENGLVLAELTGAITEVVSLFAVLHDSRRINEGHDPNHGLRGAELAEELRGAAFGLNDEDFRLLFRACLGHTTERDDPDVTVQTCYDADRLDLGRVSVTPDPRFLCTEAARQRTMIRWADGRGAFRIVPEWVQDEWGIAAE